MGGVSTVWRVVEGYYRCPFPFSVFTAALTDTFPIVVDGLSAMMTLPSADGVNDRDPLMREPAFYYTEHDIPQGRLPGSDPFWGSAALWMAGNTPLALHINRFRLCIQVEADDVRTQKIARRFAEAMPAWWRAVAAWIEVLYEQDLSRLGPFAPGVHFNGTTLWTQFDRVRGGLLPVGSSLGRFNMVDYRPLDADGLNRCISLGQQVGLPPDEWLLVRDARSFFNGYDHRRALLDAGLAAELAVTRLITEQLTSEGRTEAGVADTLAENSMLGRLCAFWVKRNGQSALPERYYSRLVKPRNDATHLGERIDRNGVKDAVAVAAAIVESALPLPA